jgi:hypothetical protein
MLKLSAEARAGRKLLSLSRERLLNIKTTCLARRLALSSQATKAARDAVMVKGSAVDLCGDAALSFSIYQNTLTLALHLTTTNDMLRRTVSVNLLFY